MHKVHIELSLLLTQLHLPPSYILPTITYSCADNQLNNVLQFQEDGLMAYAGDIRNTNIFKKTEALLKRLDDSYQLRKECSEKMQGLVDGNGSIRIAEELIKFS